MNDSLKKQLETASDEYEEALMNLADCERESAKRLNEIRKQVNLKQTRLSTLIGIITDTP